MVCNMRRVITTHRMMIESRSELDETPIDCKVISFN